MSIEEQQRAQRLILGRRRHVPFDSERAEELRHFGRAHLGRMRLPWKRMKRRIHPT
jgi:hypothetical protein